MQLVGQNEVVVAEGSSKDSPQSVSEGDVPPGSPSSPSSPSKSNAAAREKPVKVLPCPRCESMNTKFCYYNNYSVTQPRHFCRQCQRYWTAGGTLRNVPVGGGSRKKNRHPRGGEPYLQRPPNSTNPSGPPPFGVPASGAQTVNVGFQQMLSQDMVPLNFAQLPGFPHQYYGLQENHHHNNVYASMLTNTNNRPPQPDLPPAMHAMYGTGPMTAPMANAFYVTHEMAPPSDNVKPELWPNNSMPPPKNGRFEQLNLRLNNNRPGWDHGDVKPKNGSPPHGSSTIEEEGSTPTNGYSNNGYEEGDTVSSMWHSLHDDNMFHDTMFQLNGDDHRC